MVHFDGPLIRDAELKLIYTEGFGDETDFARCLPDEEFNLDYLLDIGIEGFGMQLYLLRLQSELHAEYTQISAVPSPQAGRRSSGTKERTHGGGGKKRKISSVEEG